MTADVTGVAGLVGRSPLMGRVLVKPRTKAGGMLEAGWGGDAQVFADCC